LSGANIDEAPSQQEARLAIELRKLIADFKLVTAPFTDIAFSFGNNIKWDEVLGETTKAYFRINPADWRQTWDRQVTLRELKNRVSKLVNDLIATRPRTGYIVVANNNLKNALPKLLEVAKKFV
jgi:hypothetical protein